MRSTAMWIKIAAAVQILTKMSWLVMIMGIITNILQKGSQLASFYIFYFFNDILRLSKWKILQQGLLVVRFASGVRSWEWFVGEDSSNQSLPWPIVKLAYYLCYGRSTVRKEKSLTLKTWYMLAKNGSSWCEIARSPAFSEQGWAIPNACFTQTIPQKPHSQRHVLLPSGSSHDQGMYSTE